MDRLSGLKAAWLVLLVVLVVTWPLAVGAVGNPSSLLQSSLVPRFGPLTFTSEFDARTMTPVGGRTAFDFGVEYFYVYARFEGAVSGTPVKTLAYFTLPFVRQEVLCYEREARLDAGDGVWWDQVVNQETGPLPAGRYRVVLEVNGQPVVEGETVVGALSPSAATSPAPQPAMTQAPPPPPPPPRPEATPTAAVAPPPPKPPAPPSPAPVNVQSGFGPITFCQDVTEDGQPIGPRQVFPAGTKVVNALFTYENMQDGTPWGQLWTRNGEVYLDATKDKWEEGPNGWTAYYVEDEPLSGEYTLTLFINGAPVQQGSFTVEAGPPAPEQTGPAQIESIIFCEDVTDDGEPINPSTTFPRGTQTIWAYFTYKNMAPGQPWARRWTLNGEPYVDASGLVWAGERDSWAAYSIHEDQGLPSGEYRLQIYLGDRVAQEAAATVEGPVRGQATFGWIVFAPEITEDHRPVGAATSFAYGVTGIYGLWDYRDVAPDQLWSAEWVRDGEVIAGVDQSEWRGQPDGTTYLQLSGNGQPLGQGQYALNLYLDGELAQSATFVVNPPPPKTLEELIDPAILPVWYRLMDVPLPEYAAIPGMVVKWQIPIYFSDKPKYAAYRSPDNCNTEAGEVLVSSNLWNNFSSDEIAATLGHELYHAYQVLEKGYSCDCTQEKELEAAIVEFGTLRYLGRDDILDAKWSGLWDKSGNFRLDVLWDAIQSAYSHCPKYEPR